MPHVVIEEALDLAGACRGLEPTAVRNGGEVLKLVDVFLNRSGRTALVDCVVVDPMAGDPVAGDPVAGERGRPQTFFVQLSQKDRQITVRLLPATDPRKTDGVKRLMALIAHRLRESTPGSRFGQTNLQEFLE